MSGALPIEYLPEAQRALLSLPRDVRRSVRRRVQRLADTPRPAWADYMWGEWEGYWRFHVGPGAYRVIYTIEDRIPRVLIIRVDHRGRVYDQPPPSR